MPTLAVRNSFVKRNALATPLFQLAAVLRMAAYGIHAVATRLNAWLEERRAVAAALRELNAMSARELRDIGLTRFDVQNETWTRESTLEGHPDQAAMRDDYACNPRRARRLT